KSVLCIKCTQPKRTPQKQRNSPLLGIKIPTTSQGLLCSRKGLTRFRDGRLDRSFPAMTTQVPNWEIPAQGHAFLPGQGDDNENVQTIHGTTAGGSTRPGACRCYKTDFTTRKRSACRLRYANPQHQSGQPEQRQWPGG